MVIGDFKLAKSNKRKYCGAWKDSKTGDKITLWHGGSVAFASLFVCNGVCGAVCNTITKYGNTYSHRTSVKHNKDFAGWEGIVVHNTINKTTSHVMMDNIKIKEGSILDRFSKQVLDIVFS